MRKTALTILIAISAMGCFGQTKQVNHQHKKQLDYQIIRDTVINEKGEKVIHVIPIVPIDYKLLWRQRRRYRYLADSIYNGILSGTVKINIRVTQEEVFYRILEKQLDEILEP